VSRGRTDNIDVRIDALLAGRVRPFGPKGVPSGIDKTAVDGPVRVTIVGLDIDEQGDPKHHGGPEKAIHHYPHDHYPAWREELGDHPLLRAGGAFGENLSSVGMTEADVCLGDRYLLGTALVEVSQLRQPCWKLSDRFAVPDMARRVQNTGRTGWYYRVLQAGTLAVGDRLVLRERPHPTWPLSRMAEVLYRRGVEPALLEEVLRLPLVPSWRLLFERRLAQGQIENWDRRLHGTP